MIKNLGTFGASVSTFLLLGHAITSNASFISSPAWKIVAFMIAIVIAFGVTFIVHKETENEVLAIICGLGALAGLSLIVGAIT